GVSAPDRIGFKINCLDFILLFCLINSSKNLYPSAIFYIFFHRRQSKMRDTPFFSDRHRQNDHCKQGKAKAKQRSVFQESVSSTISRFLVNGLLSVTRFI